ncbi:MAG: hypothetical protein ACRDIB_07540 [Ardenticatenaceae bacterium]
MSKGDLATPPRGIAPASHRSLPPPPPPASHAVVAGAGSEPVEPAIPISEEATTLPSIGGKKEESVDSAPDASLSGFTLLQHLAGELVEGLRRRPDTIDGSESDNLPSPHRELFTSPRALWPATTSWTDATHTTTQITAWTQPERDAGFPPLTEAPDRHQPQTPVSVESSAPIETSWNIPPASPTEPLLDPDLLAELVNEALAEQARRHGVDLS